MSTLFGLEIGEARSTQEIPAFLPQQYAEALNACAMGGVAKIVGQISELSRHRISNNMTFVEKKEVTDEPAFPTWTYDLPAIPELKEMHNAVHMGINRWKYFDPILVPARDPEEEFMGHLDTMTPFGMSALSLIEGPEALFIASENIYKITKNVFDGASYSLPQYMAAFNPGDTILIRQRINYLNGRPVKLFPMIHEGIAHEDRKVLALDFRSEALWLPPMPLVA